MSEQSTTKALLNHLQEQEEKYNKQIDKFKNLIDKYHIDKSIINIQDDIETMLLEILPHGSGIDCDWRFEFYNNGSIKCSNFFHAMNNNGYYVKYIPISIRFFRHKKNVYSYYGNKTQGQIIEKKNELDYKIYAPINDHYVGNLNDYLDQTVWYLNWINREWYLKVIDKKDMKKPYTLTK